MPYGKLLLNTFAMVTIFIKNNTQIFPFGGRGQEDNIVKFFIDKKLFQSL